MPGFDTPNTSKDNSMTELPPGSTPFDLGRCTIRDIQQPRPWREPEVPMSPPLRLDDARVPQTDGSGRGELVYDRFNRIKEMHDGAGRQFSFGYDDYTNQINMIQNDTGRWYRQSKNENEHCYSNVWVNEDGFSRWTGDVAVSPKGYSFADTAGRLRVQYEIGGAKNIEYMNHGDVYGRRSELTNGDVITQSIRDGRVFASETQYRNGDVVREDFRINKKTINFHDGRSGEINLADNSSIYRDSKGRMTNMKDAAGHDFQIGKYDEDGKPSTFVDGNGRWVRVNNNEWWNRETSQRRNDLSIDSKSGSITYSDRPGSTVTCNRDGSKVAEYGGIRTVTTKDGFTKREYVDGKDFLEPPAEGVPQFTVKDGITTGVKLKLNHGQMFIASGDGTLANIRVKDGSSVGAFQDGRVVMTSKNPEGDGLSAKDYAAIEKLKSTAKDQDFVVVQCYDHKSGGVRYEIYTGLDGVNVARGDVVKRGQPIGKAGHGEFNYSVNRQRPSGPAIKFI